MGACCDLVEMALLAGLRCNEWLSLHWDTVNRVERTFYLSHTKNGDALELPISEGLAVLIDRRRHLVRAQHYHDLRVSAFADWSHAVA